MAQLGYRAQLPGSIGQRNYRLAPGSGSAMAQGLQQLGKTLLQVHFADRATDEKEREGDHRIAMIEQQRARGQAVAEGMGRMAQFQLDTETELQELREQTDPGAPQFGAKAEEVYRRRWQEFRDTLPDDPEVQQHFEPIGARWVTAGTGEARAWERTERTRHMGASLETSVETSAAALFSKPDPASLGTLLEEYDRTIALLPVPGTDKAKLGTMVRTKLAGSTLDGLIAQGGYDAVEAALATGEFDWMGPDAKARWLKQAEVGKDAAARAAEAAANEAERGALEGLATLKVRLERGGEEVPTVADINAAMAAAKAAGVKDSDLLEFQFLAEDAVRARTAQGVATPQIEAGLADLRAKMGTGAATDAERRTAAAYEAELAARDVKAGAGIKDLAATDPAGAVEALAAMPVERRWAAASEAGAERLAVFANLTPTGRRFALEGRKLRTERPDDFLPPKGSLSGQSGGATQVEAMFRQAIGPHLVDELGESFGEHFDASLDAMAGAARKWDEPTFGRMVQLVFGQTRRPNGTWQGGIGTVRGRKVELPPQWTASEFESALSRWSFEGAVYGDGKAAAPEDVRRHYRPRYIGEGEEGRSLYYLVDAQGRPLKMKGGGNYVIRFGRQP